MRLGLASGVSAGREVPARFLASRRRGATAVDRSGHAVIGGHWRPQGGAQPSVDAGGQHVLRRTAAVVMTRTSVASQHLLPGEGRTLPK